MKRVHAGKRKPLIRTNTFETNRTLALRRGGGTLYGHGGLKHGTVFEPSPCLGRESVRLKRTHGGLQHVIRHRAFDDVYVARTMVNDNADGAASSAHERRHDGRDGERRRIQNRVLLQDAVQLQNVL